MPTNRFVDMLQTARKLFNLLIYLLANQYLLFEKRPVPRVDSFESLSTVSKTLRFHIVFDF